jgi:hypothetical protein
LGKVYLKDTSVNGIPGIATGKASAKVTSPDRCAILSLLTEQPVENYQRSVWLEKKPPLPSFVKVLHGDEQVVALDFSMRHRARGLRCVVKSNAVMRCFLNARNVKS